MTETVSRIIDVECIDLLDLRYKISFSNIDEQILADSIKTTGLIYPPVLRPVENNQYIIISGFNRVNALIKNRYLQIPAIIVPENTPDADCLKKAICAVSFRRPLTHAELILSITRLSELCDIQSIVSTAPWIFNLHLNAAYIQDMIKIGKLPSPCMELIQNDQLSVQAAKRITGLNTQTISVFLDLFSKIRASLSKQLEIITFFTEIAARDGLSSTAMYQEEYFQTILTNENTPAGVKTNEIRQLLYEKRYPSISTTKKKVRQMIDLLKLGESVKLTPPENFEGISYSIMFTAKNIKEFNANLDRLNSAARDQVLEQIFKS